MIDRGFVRLDEGLVHYRHVPPNVSGPDANLPLYMVHAGPVSSLSLAPLMSELPNTRAIYAPDTLGFGDSAPPFPETPDIDYYVDSAVRVMDRLELPKVDFYGSHTGATIGCELAIRYPERIGKLVLEGLGLFSSLEAKDMLQNYAPARSPDAYGSHLLWAWNFMRDQSLFFPYYKRDPDHRLGVPVFPTAQLNTYTIDVLKALQTYHKGYNAVFRHDIQARLPLIAHKTLLIAHSFDPLHIYLDEAKSLLPSAQTHQFSAAEGLADQARLMDNFLSI